jgi:hypothetical protein
MENKKNIKKLTAVTAGFVLLMFSMTFSGPYPPIIFINNCDYDYCTVLEFGKEIELRVLLQFPEVPDFKFTVVNLNTGQVMEETPLVDNIPPDQDITHLKFKAYFPLLFDAITDGDTLLFIASQRIPQYNDIIVSDSIRLTVYRPNMTQDAFIKGSVLLQVDDINNVPLKDIKVQATLVGGSGSSGSDTYVDSTDSNGNFIIAVPDSGLYNVSVILPPRSRYYDGNTTYYNIAPGTSNLTFILKEYEGQVFGHVIDASTQWPIPNAHVQLYVGSMSGQGTVTYPTTPDKTIKTNPDGGYIFYFKDIMHPIYVKIVVPPVPGYIAENSIVETVVRKLEPSKGPFIIALEPAKNQINVTGEVVSHDLPERTDFLATLSVFEYVTAMDPAMQGDVAYYRESYNSLDSFRVYGPVENYLNVTDSSFSVDFEIPAGTYVAVLEVEKSIFNIDTIFSRIFEVKQHFDSGALVFSFDIYYRDGIIVEDPSSTAAIKDATSNASLKWSMVNYPNPFNSVTNIGFNVPKSFKGRDVGLSIFDARGRIIMTWTHRTEGGARLVQAWDARNRAGQLVGDGVYFCELRSADKIMRRKMILMR